MAGMDREMKYLWVHDDHKIYLYYPRQKMTKIYPLMDTSISDLFVTGKYIYSIYNDGKLYLTDINSSLNQEIHIPYEYGDLLRKHYPKIYVDRNDGTGYTLFRIACSYIKKSPDGMARD